MLYPSYFIIRKKRIVLYSKVSPSLSPDSSNLESNISTNSDIKPDNSDTENNETLRRIYELWPCLVSDPKRPRYEMK